MFWRKVELYINDLFNFDLTIDGEEVDVYYFSRCRKVKDASFYDGNASSLSILHFDDEALSLSGDVRVLDRCQLELSLDISRRVRNALINNLDSVISFVNAHRELCFPAEEAPSFDTGEIACRQLEVLWKLDCQNASFINRNGHFERHVEDGELLHGMIVGSDFTISRFDRS